MRAQDEFVDISFDDVIVVDHCADREQERAGGPLRVCLLCGQEEPSGDGICAHDEVAAFAEASATVFEAAERVRRAMAELVKAQRALAAQARSAVTVGEAVIDARMRAPAASVNTSEPVPCAACAERAALEARDHERAKVRRKRAMSGHGQAAFAFASEPSAGPSEARARSESAGTGEAPAISETAALIEPNGAHNEDASKGRRRRKSAA